jgi:hypothetical protein
MLHNMHVESVCFRCFIYIYILQVFYLYFAKIDLDIAYVCNDFQGFSGVLQMFRTYVASVSTISDVYSKCFI